MLEYQKNPVEGEDIFCFDEDEAFFEAKEKSTNDFHSSASSSPHQDRNKKYFYGNNEFTFDASRLPNFEDEEILSIRPKKNFSFDIMQNEEWEVNAMSNTRSACFDLSSMFQNISLSKDHQGSSAQENIYGTSCEEMTIEGLRIHLRSCFTCGVHWHEEQASLDCTECGGYALSRPCPDCDGKCHETWTRNLDQSHCLGKAKWVGTCTQRLITA